MFHVSGVMCEPAAEADCKAICVRAGSGCVDDELISRGCRAVKRVRLGANMIVRLMYVTIPFSSPQLLPIFRLGLIGCCKHQCGKALLWTSSLTVLDLLPTVLVKPTGLSPPCAFLHFLPPPSSVLHSITLFLLRMMPAFIPTLIRNISQLARPSIVL